MEYSFSRFSSSISADFSFSLLPAAGVFFFFLFVNVSNILIIANNMFYHIFLDLVGFPIPFLTSFSCQWVTCTRLFLVRVASRHVLFVDPVHVTLPPPGWQEKEKEKTKDKTKREDSDVMPINPQIIVWVDIANCFLPRQAQKMWSKKAAAYCLDGGCVRATTVARKPAVGWSCVIKGARRVNTSRIKVSNQRVGPWHSMLF